MEIKRRFARWNVNLPARIRLAGAVTFVNCHICDISMMGVKVSLPIKLPEDKFFKITLALSDTFVLNVEAWVSWHKAGDNVHNYGLYFTRIADSDKEKIYRYIYANHRPALETAWWPGEDRIEKECKELEDKRIFQRFTARFPVRFLDAVSGNEGEAVTVDISAKGIGICAKENLKPHTPIEVWLQIPDKGEPVYTRGEVVWSSPVKDSEFRCGVNLEKADLMGLSRVLRA